jgi:hydrogenase nickel incorporation protein HypA/HybF
MLTCNSFKQIVTRIVDGKLGALSLPKSLSFVHISAYEGKGLLSLPTRLLPEAHNENLPGGGIGVRMGIDAIFPSSRCAFRGWDLILRKNRDVFVIVSGNKVQNIGYTICRQQYNAKRIIIMHEMGIAEGIVGTVRSVAIQHHARHVRTINLEIGEANAIISDSLIFCFAALTADDPLLTGAELQITHIPHQARCHDCEEEFSVPRFILQCPRCSSLSTEVLSGTEFTVVDIDIDTDFSTEAQ